MNDLQMFQEHLEAPFCELQTDPIVNVRIQLSYTLKSTFDASRASSRLKQTVRRLKFDSSRDISSPLSGIDLPVGIFETNESVELVKSLLDAIIF